MYWSSQVYVRRVTLSAARGAAIANVVSISSSALVIDDGSLGHLCALLHELHVDFRHVRGDARTPFKEPRCLLATTAAIGARLRGRRSRQDSTWLVFMRGTSRSQRGLLQQGFDMMIPERVHRPTLQHLLRGALYQGANTQRVRRVPVGQAVAFGGALRRERGVLVDLSPRGCRLLTARPPARGRGVVVYLASQDESLAPLAVKGQVIRTSTASREGGGGDESSVAVSFDPLKPQQRSRLKQILYERLEGPVAWPDGAPAPEATLPTPQRLLARVSLDLDVTAVLQDGLTPLRARDMSESGMRVDPHPRLPCGLRLTVAIPIGAREEPVVIQGQIARDDGDRGLAIHFDPLRGESLRRLRTLIASSG